MLALLRGSIFEVEVSDSRNISEQFHCAFGVIEVKIKLFFSFSVSARRERETFFKNRKKVVYTSKCFQIYPPQCEHGHCVEPLLHTFPQYFRYIGRGLWEAHYLQGLTFTEVLACNLVAPNFQVSISVLLNSAVAYNWFTLLLVTGTSPQSVKSHLDLTPTG